MFQIDSGFAHGVQLPAWEGSMEILARIAGLGDG